MFAPLISWVFLILIPLLYPLNVGSVLGPGRVETNIGNKLIQVNFY